LSWEPNPQNTDVAKYRLYQVDAGQTLIAEVPASQFNYTLRNMDKAKAYVFAITAVDEASNESESAPVTVSGGPTKEITRRQGLARGQKGIT
jgi:fibronectin type 3 domain-containing protein